MIDAHIVDVSSIKKILSNCTYYDLIIDYEFNYNDKTTIDLINWYKDFIFTCNIKISREEKLLKIIARKIVIFTNKYEDLELLNINSSRWI